MMGKRVAAMIMNGLGFMDDRLYMFSEFLANKPVDKLFKPVILEQICLIMMPLGRYLDPIAAGYGPTKLFSEIDLRYWFSLTLISLSQCSDLLMDIRNY